MPSRDSPRSDVWRLWTDEMQQNELQLLRLQLRDHVAFTVPGISRTQLRDLVEQAFTYGVERGVLWAAKVVDANRHR